MFIETPISILKAAQTLGASEQAGRGYSRPEVQPVGNAIDMVQGYSGYGDFDRDHFYYSLPGEY